MTTPPPDGSRDRRIEDPSNLLLIHPAARRLLPPALRAGVSANSVSVTGLVLGVGAAIAFPREPLLGLLFATAWLVADGLDGMIARATGTASALGRFLDGLCDHGVFILIYVSLAAWMGTAGAWALAVAAGAAHAVQSSLFEGERARFHRRLKGVARTQGAALTDNPLVRLYDRVATAADRFTYPFERLLAGAVQPLTLGRVYAEAAVPAMRLLSLQSANVRVFAIFVACVLGDPRLFWWFELLVLTPLIVAGFVWHRRIERSLAPAGRRGAIIFEEQGQS